MSTEDTEDMDSIQLISHNMRREEMMSQIVLSLDQLWSFSDNVFKQIDDKIQSINDKLLDINQRRNTCVQKIQRIRHLANKATKIYANYKYPKEEIVSNHDFCPLNRLRLDTNCLHSVGSDLKVNSSHIPFDEQLLKEKTQFYSIPKTCIKSNECFDFYDLTNAKSTDPLGPIPWQRITSLSSLLVFNTADNAFLRRSQGSSIYDQKIRNKRLQELNVQNSDIFKAPESILNSETAEKPETLHYLPEVQSPPQMMDDLPQALPSLPGIADDIAFNQTDEEFLSSAIPNLNTMIGQLIPQLPEIKEIDPNFKTIPTNNVNPVQDVLSLKQTMPQITQIEPQICPPPPPAPPPPPPPPPPPSPPPMPATNPVLKAVETVSKSVTQISSVDTNRASLLESIRAAAGKPKKSMNKVIERKIEAKMNKQKEVVITGDLMSDLFNKLSMRRKGISGGNAPKEQTPEPSTAMERISAMIPPPPPTTTGANDEDTSDDWE